MPAYAVAQIGPSGIQFQQAGVYIGTVGVVNCDGATILCTVSGNIVTISSTGGGGGGAPTNASYWTRVSEAGLSNETALGALATGLILNTTTTGVPVIYTGTGPCSAGQFFTQLSPSGVATCGTPSGGGGVSSLNGLTGALSITDASGTQFTIVPSGSTIDLSHKAGGTFSAFDPPGGGPTGRWLYRFFSSTDGTTTAPGFSDDNSLEVWQNVLNGQENGDATTKMTFIANNVLQQSWGAGQRVGLSIASTCRGMGDCLGQSMGISSAAGVAAGGDEGNDILSATLLQQGSLSLTTIASVPAQTTCNTTLTQAVTASVTPQAVTVASTTNCNVNDWIVIDRGLAYFSDTHIEAVKITSVGGGAITGVFRNNHSNGAPVTPAVVLVLTDASVMGQLRWLVNTSATPYTTGTLTGQSASITVTGTGTSWSAGMAGGDATLPGCFAFTADDYSGAPFNGTGVSGTLKTWYPVNGINSGTSISLGHLDGAGISTYRGNYTSGSGSQAYTIRPCARILQMVASGVNLTNTVVLETNTFTWTAAQNVEGANGTNAEVQPVKFNAGWYGPGAALRGLVNIENVGNLPFGAGINIPASASSGNRYTTGIDMAAQVGNGVSITNASDIAIKLTAFDGVYTTKNQIISWDGVPTVPGSSNFSIGPDRKTNANAYFSIWSSSAGTLTWDGILGSDVLPTLQYTGNFLVRTVFGGSNDGPLVTWGIADTDVRSSIKLMRVGLTGGTNPFPFWWLKSTDPDPTRPRMEFMGPDSAITFNSSADATGGGNFGSAVTSWLGAVWNGSVTTKQWWHQFVSADSGTNAPTRWTLRKGSSSTPTSGSIVFSVSDAGVPSFPGIPAGAGNNCLQIDTAGVVSNTGSACGSGGGGVTTTGSPASGNLTKFSGASTITNGDLSGDVTTSGTLATTIANNAVTLAKLATQANNTILANVSGGTAVPTAATLTSILDILGTAQGNIIYRGASTWTVLAPGTSGQVLSTQGAGANPQWISAGGTGTVTSIATTSPITGGTITTTGTIACATCVTSAASLTNNQLVFGAGSQGVAVGDLTGDVTTSGGKTTTLANIPTATPAAGSIIFTNIAAPSSPASGKVTVFADSTDLRFHDKNASGVIGTTVVADTGASNQFLTAISAAGAISKAQPSFTNLSGSLACGQHPALTGDVTTSAGSCATTVVNLPTGTTMAGSLLATAITAPGTPASGKGSIYVDSTSKNLAVKDDAGVVKHGVQTDTGASNNFLTAISDSGAISKAQPSFANLSGIATPAQLSATVNAQTGTSYTVVDGDRGKLVTTTNASAIAITLPQAGGGGSFISGWFAYFENRGAGTATITPTTSTIDGAASLALTTNQGVTVFSDGTNYFTGNRGLASGGGSGTVTSIATTSPITGGTITTTGTIACATCVTSAAALTNNQLVFGAGSQATAVGDLTGDITTSGGKATTLKNTGTAGTYDNVTTDAQGRVTSGVAYSIPAWANVRYYDQTAVTAAINSLTSRLAMYFDVPANITVNQISMDFATATTPGTLKLCVYTADGATKVIDITITPVAGAIVSTSVAGITLAPGAYYSVVGCATTCNLTTRAVPVETTSLMFGGSTPSGKLPHHGTVSHTSGTCNSTLGTVTGSTAVQPVFRMDN